MSISAAQARTAPRNDGAGREKVWVYAAVSTSEQADTLDDQRAWCYGQAEKNDWHVAETMGGVGTGRHGVRVAFEETLEALRSLSKSQRPQRLLMIRLDRMGRGDGIDSIAAVAELRKLGVIVHTRDLGDVRINRAADSVVPVMQMITAGIENEIKSDKSKAAWERRRKAGLVAHNRSPYGLEIVDGRFVADEKLAPTVREVFRLRAEGLTYYAIAERLVGVAPDRRFRNGKTIKSDWNRARIKRMITQRDYIGVVVDELTWKRANAVQTLSRCPDRPNVRAKRGEWPLSAVLRCGVCGYGLHGTSGGKNYIRLYYTCTRKALHPDPPHHVKHQKTSKTRGWHLCYPKADIEDQFVGMLRRLRMPENLAKVTSTSQKLAAQDRRRLERRIAEASDDLEALQKRADRVWEIAEDGGISPDEARRRLATLDKEKTTRTEALVALRTQLEQDDVRLHKEVDFGKLLTEIESVWHRAALDKKLDVVKAFAQSVGGISVGLDGRITTGKFGHI